MSVNSLEQDKQQNLLNMVPAVFSDQKHQEILKSSLSRTFEIANLCPISGALQLVQTVKWFHLNRTFNNPQARMTKDQILFDLNMTAMFRDLHFQAINLGRHKEAIEVCARVGGDCPDQSALTGTVANLWCAGITMVKHSKDPEQAKGLVAAAHEFMEPIAPNKTFAAAVQAEMKKMDMTSGTISAVRPLTSTLHFRAKSGCLSLVAGA